MADRTRGAKGVVKLSRLRDLRLETRLTQQDFAAVCGVDTRTITRWEAGKGASLDQADTIAAILAKKLQRPITVDDLTRVTRLEIEPALASLTIDKFSGVTRALLRESFWNEWGNQDKSSSLGFWARTALTLPHTKTADAFRNDFETITRLLPVPYGDWLKVENFLPISLGLSSITMSGKVFLSNRTPTELIAKICSTKGQKSTDEKWAARVDMELPKNATAERSILLTALDVSCATNRGSVSIKPGGVQEFGIVIELTTNVRKALERADSENQWGFSRRCHAWQRWALLQLAACNALRQYVGNPMQFGITVETLGSAEQRTIHARIAPEDATRLASIASTNILNIIDALSRIQDEVDKKVHELAKKLTKE